MPAPAYVVALDLATKTGFARGYVGGMPEFGSLRFASPGASDKAIFHSCLRWAHKFLGQTPRADVLAIEALLPPTVVKGETNTQTIYRLAGLHGIVLAVAYEHGIYRVETPSVGDIRGHFINDRACKREQAKREVIRKCLALGWAAANDDQGDALALWHLQCARLDPKLALEVSPLFHRGVAL